MVMAQDILPIYSTYAFACFLKHPCPICRQSFIATDGLWTIMIVNPSGHYESIIVHRWCGEDIYVMEKMEW
jgi:hypothetical protein